MKRIRAWYAEGDSVVEVDAYPTKFEVVASWSGYTRTEVNGDFTDALRTARLWMKSLRGFEPAESEFTQQWVTSDDPLAEIKAYGVEIAIYATDFVFA